ncbi:SRPBCC family protein [Nocardioides sp. MAH-18]|uniref:SRPBCC family protein n=1 Tax=Nocardioides agri TaxID=2682843 RepID=A0A6L6XZC2_9ACTN|nr:MULTISPECIES: SRPBCC family protein [unclassified Nocardioides]MBA2952911.1 SRPBCC family protein [Nocardioides sp. CGMCC 1.13656]MVQ52073.1 SRPBCC family protein [Nocardioides sp. MAH-18]
MSGYRVEASRLLPVEQTVAFDRLMGAPLPDLFSRRYAAFPPVQEVVDEPADWGSVGQDRVIRLADGGSLRETLTSVDRPRGFAYRLDDLHGRLRPFLRTIDGAWSVAAEGTSSRVTWTWTMYPTGSPARLTLTVIGRMWSGYAERSLEQLETILTRP